MFLRFECRYAMRYIWPSTLCLDSLSLQSVPVFIKLAIFSLDCLAGEFKLSWALKVFFGPSKFLKMLYFPSYFSFWAMLIFWSLATCVILYLWTKKSAFITNHSVVSMPISNFLVATVVPCSVYLDVFLDLISTFLLLFT